MTVPIWPNGAQQSRAVLPDPLHEALAVLEEEVALQDRKLRRLAEMHDVIEGECLRCASPAPCDHLRVIHGETQ